MKTLLAFLALLTGCATPPTARQIPLAAEFDQAIAEAVASLPAVPGLAVAVYSREGSYARAFGVTDVDSREPATPDTAFYIASATKPLTALAFTLMHARGEFDLGENLAAYAPDAGFGPELRAGQVTFRHLFAHTAGIENYPIAFRLALSGDHDATLLWSLLAASKVNERAPLGTFRYTNVDFNIATLLTDRKLGVRWQDLLRREVFAPAGMTRSSATMSEARRSAWRVARPHAFGPETGSSQRLQLEKSDATMQSAGGVIMSARDAARWLELMVEDGRLDGRQVWPASAVQATRAPLAVVGEVRDGFGRDHYTLGWYLGRYRDDTMLHHFGSFAGARVHVSYLPDRRAGVAVFLNDNSVSASVVDLVAKYVYDRLAGRAEARAEFDAAMAKLATEGPARRLESLKTRAARPWLLERPREAYAGTYVSADMGTMRISVEAGEISVRIGVLQAVATPFTEKDSIRVELMPGQGDVIRFESGGGQPPALNFLGSRFQRQ